MRAGDTIVATATGAARGARALVRASGPAVPEIERRLLGLTGPRRRAAVASRLRTPGLDLPVLALRFVAPASYTGEDALELLLPGNPLLIERAVGALLRAAPAVRAAEPGEFTARAFLAGRLTLAQAEGVAALIAARSDEELAAAGEVLRGEAGARFTAWMDEAATLLALVEAGIDFTDQEDVRAIEPEALRARAARLASDVRAYVGPGAGAPAHEDAPALPRVALVGAPNAGKSTLFNALLGRARSVESPLAGSTRDAIAEELDLSRAEPGAGRVLLLDLPGLDEGYAAPPFSVATAAHLAAQHGAHRAALDAAASADVLLWCDPRGAFESAGAPPAGLTPRPGARITRVRTKADLVSVAPPSAREHPAPAPDALPVCALDGVGLPALRRALADAAGGRSSLGAIAALLPRYRRAALRAADALERVAAGALAHASQPETLAEDLRAAAEALGELAGRLSPDDVLGRVFATFCVGK